MSVVEQRIKEDIKSNYTYKWQDLRNLNISQSPGANQNYNFNLNSKSSVRSHLTPMNQTIIKFTNVQSKHYPLRE